MVRVGWVGAAINSPRTARPSSRTAQYMSLSRYTSSPLVDKQPANRRHLPLRPSLTFTAWPPTASTHLRSPTPWRAAPPHSRPPHRSAASRPRGSPPAPGTAPARRPCMEGIAQVLWWRSAAMLPGGIYSKQMPGVGGRGCRVATRAATRTPHNFESPHTHTSMPQGRGRLLQACNNTTVSLPTPTPTLEGDTSPACAPTVEKCLGGASHAAPPEPPRPPPGYAGRADAPAGGRGAAHSQVGRQNGTGWEEQRAWRQTALPVHGRLSTRTRKSTGSKQGGLQHAPSEVRHSWRIGQATRHRSPGAGLMCVYGGARGGSPGRRRSSVAGPRGGHS